MLRKVYNFNLYLIIMAVYYCQHNDKFIPEGEE